MQIKVAAALVAVTYLATCVIGLYSIKVRVTGALGANTSCLVLVGSPVTLVCDDVPMVSSGTYSWKMSVGDASCTSDAGTAKNVSTTMTNASMTCYKCTFSYKDASDSTQVITSNAVSLYPYELKPVSQVNADLATGPGVNATCSFKALSPLVNATFFWTRGASSVPVTGSISTATDSTLVIANSTSAGDQYYCYGYVSGTTAVKGSKSTAATVNGIDGILLVTYVVTSPPYAEVYSFGKDQYTEGDNITVACKALGYPAPNVTWLREGAAINTSQQIVTIAGGQNVSFVIASLNPDRDRGAYVCVATGLLNASSHVYVSAPKTLHARSKLAPLWPAIGIMVQLAVVAIVIGLTEYFRTKRAAAAVGKGGARLDGNKKGPDTVDVGGSSSNAGGDAVGKTWKATM